MHLKRCTVARERFPEEDLYPFNLRVLRDGSTIDFEAPVTFFVGENGSGKSTLLRAIARACGIHIWEEQGGRGSAATRMRNSCTDTWK